jgi:hypothetical protein
MNARVANVSSTEVERAEPNHPLAQEIDLLISVLCERRNSAPQKLNDEHPNRGPPASSRKLRNVPMQREVVSLQPFSLSFH